MPTYAFDFGTLFWREKGQGEALLMIMGTGADHTSWARQIPVLSERFRLVTPDNRGSGRSGPAPEASTATTAGFAREALALLEHLGIDRFHVCGFSFGAAVAMEVALAAGDRVLAASFHAGWAGPHAGTDASFNGALERLREGGVARFLEGACRKNFSPAFREENPAAFEAFLKNVMTSVTRPTEAGVVAQAEAGRRHDVRNRLGGLRIPVLVTVGEHDRTIPPEAAEEVARLVPGAIFHTFRGPRAWHAIPLEMPDAFNALVGDFHARRA